MKLPALIHTLGGCGDWLGAPLANTARLRGHEATPPATISLVVRGHRGGRWADNPIRCANLWMIIANGTHVGERWRDPAEFVHAARVQLGKVLEVFCATVT